MEQQQVEVCECNAIHQEVVDQVKKLMPEIFRK